MKSFAFLKTYFVPLFILLVVSSCKKEFSNNDYTAYFGGEIENPSSRYVLFCKNNKVIYIKK